LPHVASQRIKISVHPALAVPCPVRPSGRFGSGSPDLGFGFSPIEASESSLFSIRPVALSPLGPGDDHIHLPATAPGTDKPLAPIGNGGPGAISLCHLGGVGLDLVAARLAPHDQPHFRVRGIAESHWRAG
jgi:hypothetical protein